MSTPKMLQAFSSSVPTDLTEDAERTKDRRQTYGKLGSGVLSAWMEMHSSLVASFLY
jgi:hypothetical protein